MDENCNSKTSVSSGVSKFFFTTADLRRTFIQFFKRAGHTEVVSTSLLALNNPALQLVSSGVEQFKNIFASIESRGYSRAVTAQKSLRISEEHYDLSEIGRSRRHNSFYEILGNFSIGDYFKSEAITYAWEFLTTVLNLPIENLWVTIHESDEEILNLWTNLAQIPSERIIKLGDNTNLWSSGEVGPWGYSSGIFYYLGAEDQAQSPTDFVKNDGSYVEIWNLVFMQFYKDEVGYSTPLAKSSVYTSLGLERVASILQGKKANFDSDVFLPIIAKIEELSGKRYVGLVYPNDVSFQANEQMEIDTAVRVIADHSRAAAFLIADGLVPGNEGAANVLRRLLRRAAHYGLSLGFKDNFIAPVALTVVSSMSNIFPELFKAKTLISELITSEESQFRKTLESGVGILEQWLNSTNAYNKVLPGELLFRLYDTFGFPLDLTEEYLRDNGCTVDTAGFHEKIELQKVRTGKSSSTLSIVGDKRERFFQTIVGVLPEETNFVGYSTVSCEPKFEAILRRNEELGLVFSSSSFFTEMGGQIGDSGLVRIGGKELTIYKTETLPTGQIIHLLSLPESIAKEGELNSEAQEMLSFLEGFISQKVDLVVDKVRRKAIAAHHSATHFLHSALRKILGDHVQQRGSIVDSDCLRFDFSHHKPLTSEELTIIGDLVNSELLKNYECQTVETSLEEAKKKGALSFSGDKYSDVVRMVQFGDFTLELCGGAHVSRSGDIGLFLILNEASIDSGVRRLECVVGQAAVATLKSWQQTLIGSSQLLKVTQDKLESKIELLLDEVKEKKLRIKKLERDLSSYIGTNLINTKQQASSGIYLATATFGDYSKEQIANIADTVLQREQDVEVLVLIYDSSSNTMLIKGKAGSGAKQIAGQLKELFNLRGGGHHDSAILVGVNESIFHDCINWLKVGSLRV
jgi:alanyl-tRNA synthetase